MWCRDTPWRFCSFCADKTCVEVALDVDTIAIRDGKNISQPSLHFTREEWASFLDSVSADRFELRRP